jgi:hypothetical protein
MKSEIILDCLQPGPTKSISKLYFFNREILNTLTNSPYYRTISEYECVIEVRTPFPTY